MTRDVAQASWSGEGEVSTSRRRHEKSRGLFAATWTVQMRRSQNGQVLTIDVIVRGTYMYYHCTPSVNVPCVSPQTEAGEAERHSPVKKSPGDYIGRGRTIGPAHVHSRTPMQVHHMVRYFEFVANSRECGVAATLGRNNAVSQHASHVSEHGRLIDVAEFVWFHGFEAEASAKHAHRPRPNADTLCMFSVIDVRTLCFQRLLSFTSLC